MITKPIHTLTAEDIARLIDNRVAEGRRIEYKRESPGDKERDRREFLADVSSFANTEGGHLLYGITEEAGLPISIVGERAADRDALKLQLTNIVRDGLEPKVNVLIELVDCPDGKEVLVVQVPQSWNAPHRVTLGGSNQFYYRGAAGKVPMDVHDLRLAFSRSEGLLGRLQAFHEGRITAILAERTAVPLDSGPRLVIHLLPIAAFATDFQVSAELLLQTARSEVPLIDAGGVSSRITAEGYLAASSSAPMYAHAYRNGVTEVVDGYVLATAKSRNGSIPSQDLDTRILKWVARLAQLQSRIDVPRPIFAYVALLGAKGLWLGRAQNVGWDQKPQPLDRDVLLLPSLQLPEEHVLDPGAMRPILDVMWNAFGVIRSDSFDTAGAWIGGSRS